MGVRSQPLDFFDVLVPRGQPVQRARLPAHDAAAEMERDAAGFGGGLRAAYEGELD